MATREIDVQQMTFEFLGYPIGSYGDMLIIKCNIDDDMESGDLLSFTNFPSSIYGLSSITVYDTMNITASVAEAGTDPVTYSNSTFTTEIGSYSDDNITIIDEGTYYTVTIKGETSTSYNKIAQWPKDLSITASAGNKGGYSPVVGFIALYSTKLKKYLNYNTLMSANYGCSIIWNSYNDKPLSNGFVYGEYNQITGDYIFEQYQNCSSSRFGICQIAVNPLEIIQSEYGRYGQSVPSDSDPSLITDIANNSSTLDIDTDDPGDNTNPYGDKAGTTDGSKPIQGDTGDGDFDYSYTPVPIPDLPDSETSVLNTGFINIFHPTKQQIKNLGSFMYSSFLSLSNITKAFANPMDYIQAIIMLPIPEDKIPNASSTSRVYVANMDTALDWTEITNQWIIMNCGTLTIKEPTKTYLDYGPYTKLSVYLPFIGIVDVDIDDFLDRRLSQHTITVSYHIDLLTGAFLCYISRGDGSVMYTYSGTCASQLPISQPNYENGFTQIAQMGLSLAMGGAFRMITKPFGDKEKTADTINNMIESTANTVVNSKPDVTRTGSLQGSTGILSVLYPYLIYSHPYGVWPTAVNDVDRYDLTGLPSGALKKIGALKGFTQIEAVNLEIDGAFDDEITEIEQILRNGVII